MEMSKFFNSISRQEWESDDVQKDLEKLNNRECQYINPRDIEKDSQTDKTTNAFKAFLKSKGKKSPEEEIKNDANKNPYHGTTKAALKDKEAVIVQKKSSLSC